MKTKRKPLDQYLYHEIEDESKVEAYLEDALPLVGKIVMTFNGLESALDSILCGHITDRTDSVGLLVLHKMPYGAKVGLFKRFSDDLQLMMRKTIPSYPDLVANLKNAGHLRNLVVHADWESTEDDGFTFVSVKISQKGMEQEYVQLSKDSLEQIIKTIDSTRSQLDLYWEAQDDLIANPGGT